MACKQGTMYRGPTSAAMAVAFALGSAHGSHTTRVTIAHLHMHILTADIYDIFRTMVPTHGCHGMQTGHDDGRPAAKAGNGGGCDRAGLCAGWPGAPRQSGICQRGRRARGRPGAGRPGRGRHCGALREQRALTGAWRPGAATTTCPETDTTNPCQHCCIAFSQCWHTH